jgi:hypothetical protein
MYHWPGLAWPVHNGIAMSAIQHLLQRLGFVKLGRYGLVLTPEGRIVSTRPAVLDDGTGARVVGWREGDPAITELPAWGPTPNAEPATPALQAVASRVAVPPIAAPEQPVASPVITVPSVIVEMPPAASEAVMPVAVAPEPIVDEDDWEWTIALARARVAAEQAEDAASAGPPRPAPRSSLVRTRPMPAVTVKEPPSAGDWPKAEPIGAIDYEDHSRGTPRPATASRRVTPAAPAPARPHAATPATVIPVPALPTMQNTGRASRLEPVKRTIASPAAPASLPRFAQGTGTVDQTGPSHVVSPSDDTKRDILVGDQTTPDILLPPAARAVQLPSIKRRMAQRR